MNIKRAQILVIATFLTGAILLFVVSPWLLRQYVAESPRSPNSATGQVYEFNQHGVVVFLSEKQQVLVYGVSGVGLLLLAVAAISLKKWFANKD